MARRLLLGIWILIILSTPATAGEWEAIETDHLLVRYEIPARETAARLAAHGEAIYLTLARSLELMPPPPWQIKIYATHSSFMAGTGARDWMAAVAVFGGDGHLIALYDRDPYSLDPLDQPTLERYLHHEMVHVAISGSHHDVPRWFDEGMAQFLSGEWTPTREASYRSAILAGWWLSLQQTNDILKYDGRPLDQISFAYQQSYQMVSFLASSWGRQALYDVVNLLDQMVFDQALLTVTGIDLASHESSFEDSVFRSLSGQDMPSSFWYGQISFWIVAILAYRLYLRVPQRRSLINLP